MKDVLKFIIYDLPFIVEFGLTVLKLAKQFYEAIENLSKHKEKDTGKKLSSVEKAMIFDDRIKTAVEVKKNKQIDDLQAFKMREKIWKRNNPKKQHNPVSILEVKKTKARNV